MSELSDDRIAEEQRTGISGTNAPVILGISPYQTPYDLWQAKLGLVGPPTITPRMQWGILLQDLILGEYCRLTGRQVETPGMLRHPTYDWMIGHLDGRIVGERRIVEIKTTGSPVGWGPEGTDAIPQMHLAQVHHYLKLTEAEVCDVCVLIGGYDFRMYEVRADEDIAATLIDKEHAFWQCVLDREPPPPINTRDAVQRWGRLSRPGDVTATAADAAIVAELQEIRNHLRELEAAQEKARFALMQRLGETGDTLVDLAGTPLASWKLDAGRKGYTVEPRPPTRRFFLRGETE